MEYSYYFDVDTNANQQNSSNKLLAVLGTAFIVLVFSFLALGFLAKSALQKNAEKGIAKVLKKELGKNADVNLNKDSIEVKTDEGSFSTSTKIPDNFRKDIPIYPDSKVTSSLIGDPKDSKQGPILAVTFESTDTSEKVSKYFKNELEKNGWKIIASSNYGNSYTYSAEKDSITVVIVISGDTTDKTSISVSYLTI